jgi:hypothetical protein
MKGSIFYSFCKRIAGLIHVQDVSKKAWIALHVKVYTALYKAEQAASAAPKQAPIVLTKTGPDRRTSETWVDASVWKTMSNNERQKFKIKARKYKLSIKYGK